MYCPMCKNMQTGEDPFCDECGARLKPGGLFESIRKLMPMSFSKMYQGEWISDQSQLNLRMGNSRLTTETWKRVLNIPEGVKGGPLRNPEIRMYFDDMKSLTPSEWKFISAYFDKKPETGKLFIQTDLHKDYLADFLEDRTTEEINDPIDDHNNH